MPWEIVGIVGDVRSIRVAEAPGMEFYRPWAQENFPFVNIAVRSNLKVDAVTKLAQSALTKVNPGLAIAVPQTMDAVVAQALGQARLMMWLLGIFAGVALLLATSAFTAQSLTPLSNAPAKLACAWRLARKPRMYCGLL